MAWHPATNDADTPPPPPEPQPPEPAPNALVPVRPRHDGWTAEKQRGFIEALADTGSVRAAAVAVDMTEQSAYRLRRRADAAAFDAAWEAALERGMALLSSTAFERALHGTIRTRWWRGEMVAEERVYSDRLLIWLLKHGRGVLGRADERRKLRGDWEGAIDQLREPEIIG